MSRQEQITLLDFEDIAIGGIYLSRYPKWPRIVSGYFPFEVIQISGRIIYIMFRYPVRDLDAGGRVKGDEPSIFFQDPTAKAWYAYGATAPHVPIEVARLEGKRWEKYRQHMEFRKEWLKNAAHILPATEYPMGSETIADIEKSIHKRLF